MSTLFPVGLRECAFQILLDCVKEARKSSPAELLEDAEEHLKAAEEEYRRNPLVDIITARNIMDRFRKVVALWNQVPDHAKPYCLGMIRYFLIHNDELKDLSSPIGFDDDVEVMNSCLKLACLDELCFDPGKC